MHEYQARDARYAQMDYRVCGRSVAQLGENVAALANLRFDAAELAALE